MFDITLSFDNGPSKATPEVLDLLARYGIRSTFFVVGRRLEHASLREHATRAAAEGHWIGNHSYSHMITLGQYKDFAESIVDLAKTEDLLGDLRHPDRLVRPYADGGVLDRRLLNPVAVDYLIQEKCTLVLYNVVPRDWEDGEWPVRAMAGCAVRSWSLVVLHDLSNMALPGLARFIPAALDAGATFRQDFPPDCVPMLKGGERRSLTHLVSTEPKVRDIPLGHAAEATPGKN
jgi:peptidoglycan/xylan/chitin deacetylase (PgdA/CDA1 family)